MRSRLKPNALLYIRRNCEQILTHICSTNHAKRVIMHDAHYDVYSHRKFCQYINLMWLTTHQCYTSHVKHRHLNQLASISLATLFTYVYFVVKLKQISRELEIILLAVEDSVSYMKNKQIYKKNESCLLQRVFSPLSLTP